MKAARLALAIIGWATLISGVCSATSSAPVPQQTSPMDAVRPTGSNPDVNRHGNPAAERISQMGTELKAKQHSLRGSVRSNALSHGTQATGARTARSAKSKERAGSEMVATPHQPGPVQSTGIGVVGLVPVAAIGKAKDKWQNGAIRPVTQSLGSVRHRGANPPAIGGAASAGRMDNARINGTGMHRKP
jgi:hypothetical protein